MELFVNPWSMALGGLLVSSPIIIHLINRMRFKKVRWAAMEFLLKSQKRSRRKLIIEQLLLLLLRCLLVALLGLLLARFLGFKSIGGSEAQNTLHVVLLDDTPSMDDGWREDGTPKDTYTEARRLVVEKIAKEAMQAPTAQYATVLRMSDLDNPRDFDRLNSSTIEDMRTFLAPLRASPNTVPLGDGLKRVKKIFDESPRMKHALHIVSDFRAVDWGTGSEKSLSDSFAEIKSNADVYLLDAAHPERSEKQKTPLYHDNLAILDLRSETRITAKFAPVEFQVTVANFSNSEKKNVRLTTRLNGSERAEGSVNIPSLPPNETVTARFTLAPDRVGTEENPLDRFNLVSAHLENEASGLSIDNSRYTVVEVRDRVPLLLIDNQPNLRGKKESESFFLYKLFTEPIKGFDVQVRSPAELEGLNLQPFIGVILCDIPRLSDKAIANLESYVKAGGGLAFFMGPSIKPNDVKEIYNGKLFNEGKGLFPAPIEELPEGFALPDAEREKKKAERLFSFQMQVFPREDRHPAVERLYTDGRGVRVNPEDYNKFLRFVVLDRYFKVRRAAWNTKDQSVQELMTLPNFQTMEKYTAAVNKLMARLPRDDEKYAKYRDSLRKYHDEIRNVANNPGEPLYKLVAKMENLLQDDGDRDTNRPSMRELWQLPEMAELAKDLQVQLDIVKYGDPLYIARQLGNGRVVAYMTSAGASWNDLDGFGRSYYPPLMIELQRYLGSAGTDLNLTLGTPFVFSFDPANYATKAKRWLLTQQGAGPGGALKPAAFTPMGEQNLVPAGKNIDLTFTDAREPGVYIFEFAENRPAAGGKETAARPDFRALAYNVDAKAESDLRRADTGQIEQIAKGAKLFTASSDEYSDALRARKSDLSESPWLYLAILVVLLLEQFMAVRLSYNTRGDAPATSVGRGTPAPAA